MIYVEQSGPYQDGHMDTLYIGIKEVLINAGIATPGMFPLSGTYSRWNARSHPESGKWWLRCIDSEHNGWQLCYMHDAVVSPEELAEMKEQAVIEAYNKHMEEKA